MITGIVWLAIFFLGSITSFIKGPIYALIIYFFTFYTLVSWGTWARRITGEDRLSLYAGIAVIISFIIHRAKFAHIPHFKNPALIWLSLFCINMMLLSIWAIDPEINKNQLIEFLKIYIFYCLIIAIVKDRLSYSLMIWIQIWGNWLLGWQAFSHGKMDNGRLYNIGAPGIKESNFLAAHFLLCLPLIGKFILWGNKKEKVASLIAAAFVVNALILCNSRGAFLGLIAMIFFSLIIAKKKGMKKRIIIGLLIGSCGFMVIANKQFWDRMSTIDTYEEESSATSRIVGWQAAIALIEDHPFGVGGGGWDTYGVQYMPGNIEREELLTIHNTFLMVPVEYGMQGLFFYLAFLFTTIRELHIIRKRSGSNDDEFFYLDSLAIELGILGFLVAIIFLSRLQAEGVYWYCALAIALSNLQQREISERKVYTEKKSQIKHPALLPSQQTPVSMTT